MFDSGTMFAMETSSDTPIPEPPWKARSPQRDRPARVPLTREAIVEAALRVVGREGAQALSMRGVADELGTGPASLYWHVASKDELANLMIDRVVGEIELPPPDPARWQEQLKEFGLNAWRALERYPGVAALTLGRIPIGPNLMRQVEWTLALLRGAGVPDRLAAFAGDLFGLYVGAYGAEQGSGFSSPTGEDLPPEEMVRMVRDYFASMPPDRFPNVLATVDALVEGGPEERFELGLDVLIRGLASYIER
jgi:TetR/AcrR family tetracycline transcriptional repressor